MAIDASYRPESIAIVGASDLDGHAANLIMKRLMAQYPGRVYPIHPHQQDVLGVAAYPRTSALPDAIDLLISVLPDEQLLTLIEDCPPDRVKYLLALPSEDERPGRMAGQTREEL